MMAVKSLILLIQLYHHSSPVVLNENSNWCFHEYQSTARICVSYAEAGINTKLAEDLPIHIFIDLVISRPPNSIYY